MARGAGTKKQQIEKLSEAVGEEGVAAATGIVGDYSRDVVALAYKMLPAKLSTGLGKKIDALLDNIRTTLGDDEANNVRTSLEEASNKS